MAADVLFKYRSGARLAQEMAETYAYCFYFDCSDTVLLYISLVCCCKRQKHFRSYNRWYQLRGSFLKVLKGPCHGRLVSFVIDASYASFVAIELEKLPVNDRMTASCQGKCLPSFTSNVTNNRMNFEKRFYIFIYLFVYLFGFYTHYIKT